MKLKSFVLLLIFSFLTGAALYAQPAQYELKKVVFSGNSALTSQELAGVCISKESPGWFSQFLNSFTSFGSEAVYFDSLTVPLDTKFIKDLYLSRGYFNAKVVPSYVIDREEGTASLSFSIEEGDPFYFRNVNIKGLERLPVELQNQIQNELIIDSSQVYSTQLIQDKRKLIKSFLNNNGYMDAADPIPEALVDTLRRKVDLQMEFITGERFKISEIRIEKVGDYKDSIDDELIREIAGLKPDTYYSQYENSKAYLRLYRTQLFDSLAFNRGYSDNSNNLVPLEILGKTTALHELSPEIIGNNEEDELNLGLALSFIKKNFFGDARKLTLTGTAATKNFTQIAYTDLRLGLEQPYLFGSQIRPRLEGYFTNQLWKDKFEAVFYGTKLNLDFESDLTEYTFLTSLSTYVNWEYSKYNYEKQYLLDQIKDIDSTLINKDEIVNRRTFSGDNAVIGLFLAREKTNRINFPTEGISMSLIIEDGNSVLYLLNKLFNNSFSRPLYLKTTFNFSNYYPLWDERTTAFAYKIKAGSIFTYRGNKLDIPINSRFYGGGSNSIRGWKSRELVPQIPSFTIGSNTTNEDIDAIIKRISPGGFLLFEGSLEMRTMLNDNFGTAVFLDYGNSWNELKDISLNSLAISTGLGIRIYTPLLPPLRFDFGFKLYDPYKKRLDVNKTIGELFKENFEIQFGIGEAF